MIIRFILIFLLIFAVATFAAWLADHPGSLELNWQGYRVETSLAFGIMFMASFIAVILVAFKVIRFLINTPTTLAEFKYSRGLRALNNGLLAIASGDIIGAQKLTKRATTLLDDLPITKLLLAQTAQLSGDEAAARATFDAMREEAHTELLGLRGLIAQAYRNDNKEACSNLIRRAYDINPDVLWTFEELFSLETETRNWENARKITKRANKKGLLSARETNRRVALLFLAEAREKDTSGNEKYALELTKKSRSADTYLIPNIILTTEILVTRGDVRKAIKLLEDSWRRYKHPHILKQYIKLNPKSDSENHIDLQKHLPFEPADSEVMEVLAENCIVNEQYDEAEIYLKKLITSNSNRQVCLMMATLLEKGRADTEGAKVWLRKAIYAPLGSLWICSSCQHADVNWSEYCVRCKKFGSQKWGEAPILQSLSSSEGNAQLPKPSKRLDVGKAKSIGKT